MVIPEQKSSRNWRRLIPKFTPERLVVLSFGLFIFANTFLLMLPQATVGPPLGFVDALFTATSATCVTGLAVVDTGMRFTHFGQGLILLMIQLGGLGIITFSTAFLYVLGGRLSLGSQELLFETLSQGPLHNIKYLLKSVFFSTLIIESIGSIILALRFSAHMPFDKALYHGVFHAVSAFCNAGFALYSDSFVGYQGDLIVNVTLAALLILGGFWFIVIYEFPKLKNFNLHKLSFHSKLVLLTSAFLIGAGTLLIFSLELHNALKTLPWDAKIFTAVFQSITARTAGFNTLDLGSMTNPSLFVIMLLMFIGASPASCGGGIKVTTAAVLIAFLKARFRNQQDVNLFYRRIPTETVSKAISLVSFSMLLIIGGTMLLLITELSGIPHPESRGMFLELLFESTSAFATVGLSVGLTPTLSTAGRIIVIVLMFIGRLGPLTLVMSVGRKHKVYYKFAEEKVLVG